MSGALLSINPQHVERILDGTKRFEFRKVRTRRSITRIVIYSTSPVGLVVGEAEVTGIVEGHPTEVWEATHAHAGITRAFFDEYYAGRDRAVAYRLGEVSEYREPRSLADLGVAAAPQSFVYLAMAPSRSRREAAPARRLQRRSPHAEPAH